MTKHKPQPAPLATTALGAITVTNPFLVLRVADEVAEWIGAWVIDSGDATGIEELFDLPQSVSVAAADMAAAYDFVVEVHVDDEEGSEQGWRRYEEAKARLSVACCKEWDWKEAAAAVPLLRMACLLSSGDLGSLHVSTEAHWWHRAADDAMDEGVPADRIAEHCMETTGAKKLPQAVVDALAQYEATRGGDDKKAAARSKLWATATLYSFFAQLRQQPHQQRHCTPTAEQMERQALSSRSRELIRTGQIKAGDAFQVRASGHDREAKVVETRLAKVVISFQYKNGNKGTKTVYAAELLPAETEKDS